MPYPSTEHILWLAEQDNKGVRPGERVIVCTHEGKEITRGMPEFTSELGRMLSIQVNEMEFSTWPVGADEECWLDSDGHLVYIYQEKLDQPGPPSMDLDDIDPNTMNVAAVDETFNVGDRVEVKESIGGNYRKGERGTVVKNLGPYVEVKLDEPRYAIVEGIEVEAQSTSFEPGELAHIDDKAPSLDFRKPGTTPSA